MYEDFQIIACVLTASCKIPIKISIGGTGIGLEMNVLSPLLALLDIGPQCRWPAGLLTMDSDMKALEPRVMHVYSSTKLM